MPPSNFVQHNIRTVAVIAAGGKSGQLVSGALVAHVYNVRAGFHHLPSPGIDPPNLTRFKCDANNKTDVSRLLAGADTVVSLIGHVRGSRPDIQTASTNIMIAVMTEYNITRFISLSGTGIRRPLDRITFIDRMMNASISFIDQARIRDGIDHAEILATSKLDYTLLRVLKLTNGAAKPYQLRSSGPVQTFTPRASVASAVVEVISNNSFIRQMPMIGNPD